MHEEQNHRCSKCKNKLQKNAKFCPVCGTKVKKRRMKKFLIFFGSQSLNDERKGIRYLLKALSILYDRLNNEERNNKN